MSDKQILFMASADGRGGPPFPETLLAFEDPGVDRLSFWVVGTAGYPAEACLAFVEFVEQLRSKTGKPCHTHLAAGATIQELFLWLGCGIDGRTMRSTASFEIHLPVWCRFSEVQCGWEAIQEAERNLDLMEILERINEYLPLAELGKNRRLGLFALDEYGLLDESYLRLMEKKEFGEK